MKKLKLKDNVDLKELLKFGFIEIVDDDPYYMWKDEWLFGERTVFYLMKDRSFFIEWGYYLIFCEEQERFLKDLIDTDLLEWVNVSE